MKKTDAGRGGRLISFEIILKFSTSMTWIDAFVLVCSWLSCCVPFSEQVEERSGPLEVSVCTGKCHSVTSKSTELPLVWEGEKDTQKFYDSCTTGLNF